MPVTINEVTTEANHTLRLDQWVKTPSTTHEEYARITAFTLHSLPAGHQPQLTVEVHRFHPFTCSHPCLAALGGTEQFDPADVVPADAPPEMGWCKERNDYAYFDVAKHYFENEQSK